MGNLESLRIDTPPQCQIIGPVLVQNCQTCDKSATGPLAWRRWHFCLPPKTHDWPIQGINCFLISWHFWPRGGTTPPSSKGVVVEVGDACCENNPGENVLKKSYKDDPAILEIKQYLVGLLQTETESWSGFGNFTDCLCLAQHPDRYMSTYPTKITPLSPKNLPWWNLWIGRCGLGGTELFFLDQWSSQSTLVSPKKKWHFI